MISLSPSRGRQRGNICCKHKLEPLSCGQSLNHSQRGAGKKGDDAECPLHVSLLLLLLLLLQAAHVAEEVGKVHIVSGCSGRDGVRRWAGVKECSAQRRAGLHALERPARSMQVDSEASESSSNSPFHARPG